MIIYIRRRFATLEELAELTAVYRHRQHPRPKAAQGQFPTPLSSTSILFPLAQDLTSDKLLGEMQGVAAFWSDGCLPSYTALLLNKNKMNCSYKPDLFINQMTGCQ